jgi:hypothetical protein
LGRDKGGMGWEKKLNQCGMECWGNWNGWKKEVVVSCKARWPKEVNKRVSTIHSFMPSFLCVL